MDIKKPLAIITGGTGYLGMAITKHLISKGWRIVILSRTQQDVPGVEVYACDITDEESVKSAVETITGNADSINGVIHTASPSLVRKAFADITLEQYKEHMDVAVLPVLWLAKYVIPHMSEGAAFIGITTEAIEPDEQIRRMGAYTVAKSALRSALKSLSIELPKNIRVYAVAPGFLPGGLNSDLPSAMIELFSKQGTERDTPEAVAELIGNLLGGTSDIVSGTSILVSSGDISPL